MPSMWQLLPPTALLPLAAADTELKISQRLWCPKPPPKLDLQLLHSLARVKVNGEYRCQIDLSASSDPVQLQVHDACLLLQALWWVFQEGDPIMLRCHSWKDIPVHKVQYFQSGRGKKCYQKSDFYIPKTTTGKHNGSYFHRGIIRILTMSSGGWERHCSGSGNSTHLTREPNHLLPGAGTPVGSGHRAASLHAETFKALGGTGEITSHGDGQPQPLLPLPQTPPRPRQQNAQDSHIQYTFEHNLQDSQKPGSQLGSLGILQTKLD
ncbi:LOW QUALITY PROTEIN: low affinity immunoglobulin gamma Fc region receptor III-A-like [Glossophaga mutica]